MQYNIHYAKTHFSKLLQDVAAGQEVIIANAGKPIVKLVPAEPLKKPRVPGLAKGKILYSPDYDQADKEIEDLFLNSKLYPDK